MEGYTPATIILLCGLVNYGSPLALKERNANDNFGTFWQVSDVHWDGNYSVNGNPSDYCHLNHDKSSSQEALGMYGDRNCDPPWVLALSAVQAMKKFQEKPDFILWTGDNNPHIPDAMTSIEKVYGAVSNLTHLLKDTFPNIPVYPVIGNHDSVPADLIKPHLDSYYQGFLDYANWEELIPKDEQKQFVQGGFYKVDVSSRLSLILLNTNTFYTQDTLTANETDPDDQLKWLETTLKDAQKAQIKVYIVSHVPPGVSPEQAKWMYADLNERFTALLRQYSDVIVAGIFGHEHTDSFRLVYDQNEVAVVPLFLGPAITPWKNKNNPSMRLYNYNRNNGSLVDYIEYYLDLTGANIKQEAIWQVLYQASKTYKIDDISEKSLDSVVRSMAGSQTSPLFEKYYTHYSTNYNTGQGISTTTWTQHICSLSCVAYSDYDKCMAKKQLLQMDRDLPEKAVLEDTTLYVDTDEACPAWHPLCHHHPHPRPHPHHHVPDYMYTVIYGLAALVFVLFFIVALLCCCWPRRPVIYLTHPRYHFVSASEYEPINGN